jgi:hypothetical protein
MAIARKSTRLDTGKLVTPQLLLVVAAAVVAISILLGEPLARPLNGIAAMLWVVSAVWMVATLRLEPRRLAVGAVALAGALVMAVIVRPGSYLEAIVGFALAGAAIALVAGRNGAAWSLLAPAVYFPIHIGIALGRVIASGGVRTVRTDPPPTEAFVPLSMVLAAGLAGYLVSILRERRASDRPR